MKPIVWLAGGLLLFAACSLPFFLDTGGPQTGVSRPASAFTAVDRGPLRGGEPSEVKAGLRWLPSAPDVPRVVPRPGRWQRYVLLPAQRSVCPERVAVPPREPAITLSGALTCAEQGSRAVASFVAPDARLILDFGRELSGHLQVNLAGGSAPGTLDIAYSESLAHLRRSCDRLGVERFGPPGTRQPACPRRAALTGGTQRYDDPAPRSGFRYVLLTISPRARRGAVKLTSAGVPDFSAMPHVRSLAAGDAYRGWFLSSDDALNRYWYDGAYNAQVNTVAAGQAGVYYEGIAGLPKSEPVIVDGAKRDRYVWYDLAGPKVLIPLLYGDTATPKNSLLALGAIQTGPGFIPACRPPDSFYGAPCATQWTDATGWWVIALGEYWLWTGDDRFAAGAYPAVAKALAALAGCRSPSGLIGECNGAATYQSPGRSKAPTTYMNAVYYEALLTGAKIARLAHEPAAAARLRRRAVQLSSAINARLWDGSVGAYRHSVRRSRLHPQDANVLPALWGIASPARARKALEHVKTRLWTRYGTRSGSPGANFDTKVADLIANWISHFELQARLDRGATADVRRMLDASWRYMHVRWKPIRGPQGNTSEPPSTTGWEHITAAGKMFRGAESSLAHVWSEGATVIATTGLLGLTPTRPGFSTWRLQPHAAASGLSWAQGLVPTPHGPLRSAWRISGDRRRPTGMRVDVSAPPGTSGTVYVPLFGSKHEVTIDGRPPAGATSAGDYLRVPHVGGSHTFGWGRAT